MLPQGFNKLSAAEEERLGLPKGMKFASPYPFAGMNQSDSRTSCEDTEFFYIENFIKTGNGNQRALYDVGTPIYLAPPNKSIVSFYFFNIGQTAYAMVFLNDGTAVQVNVANGMNTIVTSTVNTFYNINVSTQLPAEAQWGSQYLLIDNNITANSFWAWDGAVLYGAGNLSPAVTLTASGSNYTSAPTVVAYGGFGTGATFNATISGGSVISIAMTNSGTGYEPGDQPQLYISGGGSDDGIQLTAVLVAGAVQSVVITDPGTGYTPGTYALGFSAGAATGTYTVDATTTVVSTAITSGGSGYTTAPTVTFPSGGGASASGIATITSAKVDSVTVVHGGTNLTGTPTLTFVGGGGTGAAATAVLTAGAITSVTMTNKGSGYTTAPAVIVEVGLNNAAAANVSLMPFGVSGSSIETFQSRAWLPYPNQSGTNQTSGTFLVSAPGSFSDYATSDGGVQFESTDSFLRYQYTNIKQSNGYLYPLGDSSVSVISNVQTSGSPTQTTFNYQNTDPQIGTSWRDTCSAFSRTILFGNPLGVYGLYGGAVTKISKKIENIFTNGVFPPAVNSLLPSCAVANVFSRKIYCMLMTLKDPFTQVTENKMVCWDEKDWFIASQSVNLIYIGTQELNSNLTAWGTDGVGLYPLFNTPSSTLSKKLSTKLYGAQSSVIKKQAYTFMVQAQDLSVAQAGVNFNVTIDTNYLSPETGLSSYPLPVLPVAFQAPVPTYPMYTASSGDVFGMDIGATLTTTSPDFTVNYLAIGYLDEVAELGLAGG